MAAKQHVIHYHNVDQAFREEKHDETKWDNPKRGKAVKELARKSGAGLLAFLELRNLSTSSETAQQFVDSFPEYTPMLRKYCEWKDALYMALLVDEKEWTILGEPRVYHFEGIPQWDKMVMFVDLESKVGGDRVTIGLTHFDLAEDRKWRATRLLRAYIAEQPYPCMVCGDYNYFDNREVF